MAKERMINTRFWNDDYTDTLNANERLLYLCLFTNPDTNLAGIYEVQLSQLRNYTKLTPKKIKSCLERFEKDKKAYYINGWMVICNMPKHQKWETSPKIKAGINNILKSKELRWIVTYIIDNKIPYQYDIGSLSIGNTYDTDRSRYNSNSNSNEKSTSKDIEGGIYNDDVEKFGKGELDIPYNGNYFIRDYNEAFKDREPEEKTKIFPVWKKWVERCYRKKYPLDRETAQSQLKFLKNKDPVKIIEYTIRQNYKGLVEDKNYGKQNNESTGATPDELATIAEKF